MTADTDSIKGPVAAPTIERLPTAARLATPSGGGFPQSSRSPQPEYGAELWESPTP